MSDLYTEHYLDPNAQAFHLYLLNGLQWIVNQDKTIDPCYAEAATHFFDILESWMPQDAGEGGLHLDVDGLGTLFLCIAGSEIAYDVCPVGPENPERYLIPVFRVDNQGVYLADEKLQSVVYQLLQRAIRDICRPKPEIEFFAQWTWNTGLRPSSKWVEMRAEAKAIGAMPPRAIHWLADHS